MDKFIAMHVFTEVAKSTSFASASDTLKMPKFMVKHHMDELENWLNCRLIHRSTDKISLTLVGENYVDEAKQILASVESFKQLAHNTNETPKGEIRIACNTALSEAYLAKACIDYLNRYPDVAIDLVLDEQSINRIEEPIDIAIRTNTKINEREKMCVQPISKAKALLCAAPHYLKQHPEITHPNELKQHKVILYSHIASDNKWSLNKAGTQIDLNLAANFHTNDILILSRACLAGGGIARLPSFIAYPLIQAGELIQLLPDWTLISDRIYAVYNNRHTLSTTIRSFIFFLIDFFEKEKSEQKIKLSYPKWQ